MIIVLTGQPRHGKSQYAIKMLLDFIKDNDKRLEQGKLARDIYCNIAGVNDPDAKIKLPEVQNQDIVFKDKKLWFGEHKDCPDGYVCPNRGSVFFYDECHKTDWIKEKSGTLSNDLTCISMNEHGHEDYIFVLITQFPQYIHTHLRGLVEFHYHSKRLFGSKGSKIYKWNEFNLNPRADKSLKDAFETERFSFKKKYQDCYKSASAHDSMKLHLPKSVVYAFMLIFFLFVAAFWRYQNSNIKEMVDRQQAPKNNEAVNAEPVNTSEVSLSGQPPSIQKDTERQMQELELKMQLMQKQLALYELELNQRKLDLYKKDLQGDYTIRRNDPYLQVRGVVKMNDKCLAYNALGDTMTLSEKDCNSYVNTGKVYKSDYNSAQNATISADNTSLAQDEHPSTSQSSNTPQTQNNEQNTQFLKIEQAPLDNQSAYIHRPSSK